MRKAAFLPLCAALWLILAACAGPAPAETPAPGAATAEPPALSAPAESVPPPPTSAPEHAPTPEPPQMSALSEENAPARAAYTAALKTLLDTGVLPDGTGGEDGYLGSVEERENMAFNDFSVFDVDGDGREELVLRYTTASMAEQRGLVFDWDEAAGQLRKQLDEFPMLTFYENGGMTAGWSHNQGKAGDFWPFTLYRYDGDADAYLQAGSVDAWDRALAPEDYPADVDVSGSGFVYYIYEDLASEWDKIAPVDEAQYLAWRAALLGEGRELAVPYASLTAEHIQMLVTPG